MLTYLGLPFLGGLLAPGWRSAALVALALWAASVALAVPAFWDSGPTRDNGLVFLALQANAVVFPLAVAAGHLVRAGLVALVVAYRGGRGGGGA